MSCNFKSFVSTSLFMSLFFLPTMVSADSTYDNMSNRSPNHSNMGKDTANPTYTRQNWENNQNRYSQNQSNYNHPEAIDDQDEENRKLIPPGGQSTAYNRQWNDKQGTNRQDWGKDQGAIYSRQNWNNQEAIVHPNTVGKGNQMEGYSHQGWQNNNWNPSSSNNAPKYYSGSDSYVSNPSHYNPSGYPTYQSIPADGYYYSGYNNGHHGDYPYSQEYHDEQDMGSGSYFHVR